MVGSRTQEDVDLEVLARRLITFVRAYVPKGRAHAIGDSFWAEAFEISPLLRDWRAGKDVEPQLRQEIFGGRHVREAVRAFMAGRDPQYVGR